MKEHLTLISIIVFILLVSNVSPTKDKEVIASLDYGATESRNDTAQQSTNQNRSSSIKHIIIATIESAPFMMKREKIGMNGTIEWYGYCMDLFKELIKHLPYELTYEIYQVSDNKFGSKIKQVVSDESKFDKQPVHRKLEVWNGLIGDLHQGKAQLALAPLAVMAERELAVDFTVPFYDLVGIQILLKKPEVPQDWFKFLAVLDREVWFSITIAYFITSFVIFLFDRLSPYSHKNISRIRKLRQSGKSDINATAESIKLQNNHNVNSICKNIGDIKYDSNFILPESNKANKDVLTNDHLAMGHQLYVGSLRNSQRHDTRRQSSAFFFSGFDSILSRRNGSILPTDEVDRKPWQHSEQRGSRTFSEYLCGIDVRKSTNVLEVDDAESRDFDDGKPEFGLRDSLWFCITSLTPQGGGEAPQNLSGRVVAGAWWLFCFIIIASYTANLAAFLTVSRLDIPIESLDDLVKQYRIKYAPVDGTAEQTYFKRMAYIEEIFYNIWKDMSLNGSLSEEERSKFAVWDYPISDKYTKIWAQIQQVGMPPDIETAVKRVKKSSLDDGFALLADANVVKHAVMIDCSFKAVGDEFSRKPIALGLRKGDDQFKYDLSYAILQLINQRYMEILREKWWTNNPSRVTCDNDDQSGGISIENIGGVFIIIFAGVLLSFFVWVIERIVYKTKIVVSRDLIQRL